MERTSEQDQLRQESWPLADALKSAGAQVRGRAVKCCFHDDKVPSAGIYHDDQGVYRFKCHACGINGDVFDIRARAEGRMLGDVLKDERPQETKPVPYPSLDSIVQTYSNVQQVYRYTNPDTRLVDFAVIRYQPNGHKKFAQCSPNGHGWVKSRPEGLLPLYNRTRLRDAPMVIVVEGEKAVHALADIGIVATTNPMGAGKSHLADWTPLREKEVYLWPDNDPVNGNGSAAGIEHMLAVQKILEKLNCRLFWIDPSGLGLPPKGDVVEFLALNGNTHDEQKMAVVLVLDEARPLGAAEELGKRFDAIISGEWESLNWPWPRMTKESQSLLPDTITALCGEPGAAKSFMLLEAFWRWHFQGHKVAIFELEDDRTYHLQRVLAQMEGRSSLTDNDWVRDNAVEAEAAYARQKDKLASLGKVMWDAPDQQVTLTELADWYETRCQEGFEICVIDPVTAAVASDKPWIEDQKFIFRVKSAAKKYHSRLVYAIHPRIAQGKMGASLSRLAGGAAYSRFSHSVFWLTRHDKLQTMNVWGVEHGSRKVSFERTLKLSKARNGRGAGEEIAFHLQNNTLCFDEYGLIQTEGRDEN